MKFRETKSPRAKDGTQNPPAGLGEKNKSETITQMQTEYRRVLASNYVDRVMGGNGSRADIQWVCMDTKLLAEQAKEEGVTSDENLSRVESELRSRHPKVREVAVQWCLMLANDPLVFGEAGATKAHRLIMENITGQIEKK